MAATPTSITDTYDTDDWFDLDKYRQAAGVAYEFSKKKMEDAGGQERETIGKGGDIATNLCRTVPAI